MDNLDSAAGPVGPEVIQRVHDGLSETLGELVRELETSMDPVEYRLFLAAFTLASLELSGRPADDDAAYEFVDREAAGLIQTIRQDIPFDRLPRFLRQKIIHTPDMKKYLAAVMRRRKHEYLTAIRVDESLSVRPAAAKVLEDVFDLKGVDRAESLQDTLEAELAACLTRSAD